MANGSHAHVGSHHAGAIASIIDGIKKRQISTRTGFLLIITILSMPFLLLVKEMIDARLIEDTPGPALVQEVNTQNVSGNNNNTAGGNQYITKSPDEELVTVGFLNEKIATVNTEISRVEDVLTGKITGLDEKLTERIVGTKETLSVQMATEFKRIDEKMNSMDEKLDLLLGRGLGLAK